MTFGPQAQLSAVLRLTAREASRKICRVFRELYDGVLKENDALRDRVGRLETELRSKGETNGGAEKKNATQTVYKIKPSGQFNAEHRHKMKI